MTTNDNHNNNGHTSSASLKCKPASDKRFDASMSKHFARSYVPEFERSPDSVRHLRPCGIGP